ncbi:helix-turn-helix transcriptional regulator [Ruegeria sp. HKCCA0370]|uniref:helix-turn-helix domain-containing protein n=1 Tax=Ruegeria sp. HKCCA0370 TaxID=2682995 RepID=UPI001487878D|nr:helix-turn-helix transcriptional regulator [Ruegeria sp. HKCCA0370]
MELTQELCKAARGLKQWSVKELAEAAGLSVDTLRSFESGRTKRLSVGNQNAAVTAFEAAGIEFIPENGGGAGVRFAERGKGGQRHSSSHPA